MKKAVIIGLTGQSGAGKTTVSRYFSDKGFAVINCDLVARNVTDTGSDCNKELAEIFPECFDEQYTLDRKALGKVVFSNNQKLRQLNDTIFPYITQEIQDEIKRLEDEGKEYIILDAPTLFEAGVDRICDCIISCVALEEIRAKRIAQRDKLTIQQILNRFASQKSEEFFRKNSDFIIENNSDERNAFLQCDEIIDNIKRKFNG